MKLCQMLLHAGADPNLDTGSCGTCTPILLAAESGFLEITSLLIQRGSSLKSTTCKTHNTPGYTAFHLAAMYGHSELLRLMLQKEDPGPSDTLITPMHLAAINDQFECLEMLLNHHYQFEAAAKNVINIKCSSDPTVNKSTFRAGPNFTPLKCLGGTALQLATMHGSKSCVRLLLRYEADLEIVDERGWTPFLWAAAVGSQPIIRMLVEAGAKIHVRDYWGYNAIHLAAGLCGCPKILDQLQRVGVLPRQQGYDGSRPLHHASASENYEAASLLVSRGHRFTDIDSNRMSVFRAALDSGITRLRSLAIDFSSEPTFTSLAYSSPLVPVYFTWDVKATKYIIRKTKKVGCAEFIDHGSDKYFPALAEAAMRNNVTFVNLLLDEGANINGQWRGEGPPLKLACEMGHIETVRILVECGADTAWIRNDDTSETAVYAARYHKGVSNWLREQIHGPQNQDVFESTTSPTHSRTIMPPLPLSKLHRHIRKRASFELEYALRRHDILTILGSSGDANSPDNLQASVQNPRGLTVPGAPVDKLTQRKTAFRRGQFRERAREVFAYAHNRWSTWICEPYYRGHRLERFLLRVDKRSPSTIW